MNEKMLMGLYNAPKDKRYRSFVTRAVDNEEVWLLQEGSGENVLEQKNVYVWPDKEFILMYRESAVAVQMDVHEFIDGCKDRADAEDFVIHVFANQKDSYDVLASELLPYMEEELDRVE